MKENESHIESLLSEVEGLKYRLDEANTIIEAIREGAVDALVLQKDGKPHVYSLESADYTYRILIENFGQGALSITDEGLILYCNAYFANLIGIAPNKIVGTFFTDYVESPDAFNDLKSACKGQSSKGEIVINTTDRKLYTYISLSDLHPNVSAIGMVVTDLTEKRKNEQALLQSSYRLESKVNELNQTNSNLEQFIHVVSHDLKEPVRKILTYTSNLYETKATLFSQQEISDLNVINSSALRLNSLVDDLVKYAFSATKEEVSTLDLNSILGDVLSDLELVVTENKAQITSEGLPKIKASKVQMRQLFANLLTNAMKYKKENETPVITITASMITGNETSCPGQNCHKISFHDNGIGMENSQLTKIFTIFQRLHMRNEYSGNGIGLSICKKIMENHNGKIEAESVLGVGSIFNLFFPITE